MLISAQAQGLLGSIAEIDPEMAKIIESEKHRQRDCIDLIASENFVAKSVMEAVGSVLCNKYSEGYPGARYYGGNTFIDQSEGLCRKRALEAFRLDPSKWDVNVQPHSGSPCNFYVYTALLNPHDRIMALDLPHGGHLSHGYQTETRKVSAVSTYFECFPYRVNEVHYLPLLADLHRKQV
jgi:glycine hydroxymethyltransferase